MEPGRKIFQFGKACRDFRIAEGRQLLHGRKRIFRYFGRNAAQHILRKLIRACRRQNDARNLISGFLLVFMHGMIGNCGMRIDQDVFILKQRSDLFATGFFIGPVSGKDAADVLQHVFGNRVASFVLQLFHAGSSKGIILAFKIKQAFQVAGNQNVHRRRHRQMKWAMDRIRAGIQKIRQHMVGVAGTDESLDWKAHLLCKIPGQDIAEVAGRNDVVHRISCLDRTIAYKL